VAVNLSLDTGEDGTSQPSESVLAHLVNLDPPPMVAYNPRDNIQTRRGEMRSATLKAIGVMVLAFAVAVLGTAGLVYWASD